MLGSIQISQDVKDWKINQYGLFVPKDWEPSIQFDEKEIYVYPKSHEKYNITFQQRDRNKNQRQRN